MSASKPESSAPLAVIAGEDADYERLSLSREVIAPWEDGARTGNRRGTYEWWYFDSHLDDGSSLVVVFMNKDLAAPNDPLTPTIRIDLDLADGRSWDSARPSCDFSPSPRWGRFQNASTAGLAASRRRPRNDESPDVLGAFVHSPVMGAAGF